MSETVRFQFGKGEQVRFISHLDLMRCMERSFRRAGIMLSHTEGFNPHPKLSFGLPLPVGVISKACYMDAVIEDLLPMEELIQRLNKALPEGLKVFHAVIPEDKKAVMSLVSHARYLFVVKPLDCPIDVFTDEIKNILNQEGVYIEKETKKKSKMINIKDMIQSYEVKQDGDNVVMEIMCDAGSVSNLNPMLIWKAIAMYTDYKSELPSVERLGLYKTENGKPVPVI